MGETFEDIVPSRLKEMLSSQVPDDIGMIDHAREIDGYRYVVASTLIQEKKKLTEAEAKYKMLKSKQFTEYDRKMYTASMTKDQRAIVELLEAVIISIDKRINLIQSMLRFETEAFKRSGDGNLNT